MLIHRLMTLFLIVNYLSIGVLSADSSGPDVITSSGSITSDIESYPDKVEKEPDSLFDIFFVSPDRLDQIITHPGPDSLLLKTDPGYQIGIITPNALYLRSDMSESVISIENSSGMSMDDISSHLLDISFGRDNPKLARFKSDRDYKFFFTDEYLSSDIRTVLDFARFFNDNSNIVSIEDEECELSFLPGSYENPPYYYYNISIVSPLMFKEYLDDKSSTEHVLRSKTGKTIGTVTSERLILMNDLTGKERSYQILRGILWSMGFHGETTRYRDSFFSRESINLNLSEIDVMALRLMYGGRLQSGMDMETTRKALNLIQEQKKKTVG